MISFPKPLTDIPLRRALSRSELHFLLYPQMNPNGANIQDSESWEDLNLWYMTDYGKMTAYSVWSAV